MGMTQLGDTRAEGCWGDACCTAVLGLARGDGTQCRKCPGWGAGGGPGQAHTLFSQSGGATEPMGTDSGW